MERKSDDTCNPATTFPEKLFALWAKLPHRGKNPDSFHPLLCHMIDVAAVAGAMWLDVLSATARRKTASALGLPEAQAERWILCLAALHDLGKASPAFQVREESVHMASLILQPSGPRPVELKLVIVRTAE